jgi:hypothetical protein
MKASVSLETADKRGEVLPPMDTPYDKEGSEHHVWLTAGSYRLRLINEAIATTLKALKAIPESAPLARSFPA